MAHRFASKPDRPGALDSALAVFQRDGVRVLGYWRQAGYWVFKLVAPKVAA